MLQAIADDATDPVPVAALAHQRMRATPEALTDDGMPSVGSNAAARSRSPETNVNGRLRAGEIEE
jgi:hypothetical protein